MIIARQYISVSRALRTFKDTYEKSGNACTAIKVAVSAELANAALV